MYMSVVRWRSNTLVIFDTEGLLSLEESGSIFDNQMVTMAMLSSHLVLINHKGEFSSNLEHLIGMSFYAKLQIRSPLKPKLLFVLRDQSDTGATGIFFGQLAKLKENLFNDSKFLKSSIDDELDIHEKNVALLPNAFSSDFNPVVEVTQTWRNQAFPINIIDLRKMISQILLASDTRIYTNVPQLYQKIAFNWDAIDKLGPNLLACKTLYELSMMNELRDLANESITSSITKMNNDGRDHIDRILGGITHENHSNFDVNAFINQFSACIDLSHQHITEKGVEEFRAKTERSCFTSEMRSKVQKLIEPAILNIQGMLREEFQERLHKARRDARVSDAQRRLIASVQAEFDRNVSLGPDELEVRIGKVYDDELKSCQEIIQPELEAPDQITDKILQHYNTILQSKTANTSKQSVYNLLNASSRHQFRQACQRFDGTWDSMVKCDHPQDQRNESYVKRFMKFLRISSTTSDAHIEQLWDCFFEQVKTWFADDNRADKNKKLLLQIVEQLIPDLREQVAALVKNHSSSPASDPRVIEHMLAYIDTSLDHDVIRNKSKQLNKHVLAGDVAVIALKTLIDEAIKGEEGRHRRTMEKMHEDLKEWKERLMSQVRHMQDSFEQGKEIADMVASELFESMEQTLLDKIIHDVTEDIVKNQFINHEAIQKQAYDESFGQGNAEKIVKYVLKINRYFQELSFREIRTGLEGAIHRHTLNAEQVIVKIINMANDVAQQSECDNVRQMADEIERGLRNTLLLETTGENQISLTGVISIPIVCLPDFKSGFKTILLRINDIHGRVAHLKETIRSKAITTCKTELSRRLGCQRRCPGCGSKCSRPEPHDDELVEQWFECKCAPGECKCERPKAVSLNVHESQHHIAEAFHGRNYYKTHTPVLTLCYQQWTTNGMWVGDELIYPLQKFYNQRQPDWYNNLNALSTQGNACTERIAPPEQRRAWMLVRHVLVARYAPWGMVDNEPYDKKLYPADVSALPANFKPTWDNEGIDDT